MSPTGQPGSNFYIWAQNPMGVLTTKFHPYPINASQVIPFLRSIITFSGKKLLTPERVAGAFSLTGVFFRGSFCMSIPAIKSLCHCSSFRVNCLPSISLRRFPGSSSLLASISVASYVSTALLCHCKPPFSPGGLTSGSTTTRFFLGIVPKSSCLGPGSWLNPSLLFTQNASSSTCISGASRN